MNDPARTPLSRRRFLGRFGAATGASFGFPAILSSSAMGKGGAVAPGNRIAMAFIGCGGRGQVNLRAFLNQERAQCVAVCDVDRRHREKSKGMVDAHYKSGDCRAYSDFRVLLDREGEKLDAVCISTPDHWHAVIAVAAARAGLDIYGEAPFSHKLRDGRTMVETLKRYGRVWQTGSWQRSIGHFRRGAELVRNGRLGKILRVEVGLPAGGPRPLARPEDPPGHLDWDMWLGPAPRAPYRKGIVHYHWRWILDYGGGQMLDGIGHHADIAHWGMNRDESGPVAFEGSGDFPVEGLNTAPGRFRFIATYDDGVQMIVADSIRQPKRTGTRWIGEEGWLHVDRGNRLSASDPAILKEPRGIRDIELYRSASHHANFLDCALSRQSTIAPAETAHRSASVGHLGQIAMLTGRKIQWDPKTETIKNDPSATSLLGRANRPPWTL